MTRTKHPWPLVDVALVTADWDDGLDIATHAAAAQHRSDWQHAWVQAAAELLKLDDVSRDDLTPALHKMIFDIGKLAFKWEQRAKEQP